MARNALDTSIDDPSSLSHFLNWARDMTGGVTEDTKADDVKTGTIAQSSIQSVPPNDQHGVDKSTLEIDAQETNIIADTKQTQTSVISVSHKQSRELEEASHRYLVINKLDDSPEQGEVQSFKFMTPTQIKLAQKLEPEQSNKLTDTNIHDTDLRQEQLERAVHNPPHTTKIQNLNHGSTVSPRETKSHDVPSKKPMTLMDSMHARRSLQASTPKARINPDRYATSSSENGPLRDPFASGSMQNTEQARRGEKHDPMLFFQSKEREFYPPNAPTGNLDPVLRCRDPNVSSPSSRVVEMTLDPKAEEFKTTSQDEVVTKVGSEKTITHQPGIREESPSSIPVDSTKEQGPATPDTQAEKGDNTISVRDTSADFDHVDKAADLEVSTTSIAEHDLSLNVHSEANEPDEGLDLTPMLNVLVSRSATTPRTNTSKTANDEASPTATSISCSMRDPLPQQAVQDGVARTIIIRNLPESADPILVQSLVHGAAIASMKIVESDNCAHIKVTNAEDCQRFLASCVSGIRIKHNKEMHTVFCELSQELDEHDEVLQAYIDCGATRAVSVNGIEVDLTLGALHKLGSGSSGSRVVQSISTSFSGGLGRIIFRFVSIYNAVAFRAALRRDAEWKTKHIEFVEEDLLA